MTNCRLPDILGLLSKVYRNNRSDLIKKKYARFSCETIPLEMAPFPQAV